MKCSEEVSIFRYIFSFASVIKCNNCETYLRAKSLYRFALYLFLFIGVLILGSILYVANIMDQSINIQAFMAIVFLYLATLLIFIPFIKLEPISYNGNRYIKDTKNKNSSKIKISSYYVILFLILSAFGMFGAINFFMDFMIQEKNILVQFVRFFLNPMVIMSFLSLYTTIIMDDLFDSKEFLIKIVRIKRYIFIVLSIVILIEMFTSLDSYSDEYNKYVAINSLLFTVVPLFLMLIFTTFLENRILNEKCNLKSFKFRILFIIIFSVNFLIINLFSLDFYKPDGYPPDMDNTFVIFKPIKKSVQSIILEYSENVN